MKEKNDDHSIPTIRLKGQFATALVYARTVDENAITQIVSLCNQPFSEGTHIRVMPDVHSGAGCVIGLTMDLNRSDAVCPNLVGVDIGCGVRVSELGVLQSICNSWIRISASPFLQDRTSIVTHFRKIATSFILCSTT